MCKILLSINPEHVEHILNGSKQYEFRKTKCKERVDAIVIYATSPVQQVVAEADVETILEDTPNEIWKKTKKSSGVSRKFFSSILRGDGKR